MDENRIPGVAANEAAEKILTALYGEDLLGCPVTLESVSTIIQQAVNADARDHRQLVEALIGALRQIQNVSTPPDASEITSKDELVKIMGDRADAIHQITTKILEAWDKLGK